MKAVRLTFAAVLIALLVVMGCATFIGQAHDSVYASERIYATPWFFGLWAVLALLSVLVMWKAQLYRRLAACILMLVGGVAGILSIPAAFEKLRGRFVLIAPPVLCLLCAAGAETVFELMGRGSSYSAIFAGIFALVFLIIVIPKEKKKA